MVTQKLHIIITLIAALIMTIISMYMGDGLYTYAIKVVITIVVFYVFSSLLKGILSAKFKKAEGVTDEDAHDQDAHDEEADPLAFENVDAEDEKGGVAGEQ